MDKVSLGETLPLGGLRGGAEGLLVRFWVAGSPFTEISAKLFSPVVRKDLAGGILPRQGTISLKTGVHQKTLETKKTVLPVDSR